jgi:hypothetical protein
VLFNTMMFNKDSGIHEKHTPELVAGSMAITRTP